jgi:hypothetical protein
MDGWMGGWLDGWVGGWMDGHGIYTLHCLSPNYYNNTNNDRLACVFAPRACRIACR